MAPWEGDSITLTSNILLLVQNWAGIVGRRIETGEPPSVCPISADQQDADDTVAKITEQEDTDRSMAILEADTAETKKEALDDADTDLERQMIERHWPFDDHDEDE